MELVYFLASQVSVSFACCERVLVVKFGIIPVSMITMMEEAQMTQDNSSDTDLQSDINIGDENNVDMIQYVIEMVMNTTITR